MLYIQSPLHFLLLSVGQAPPIYTNQDS